MRRLYATMVALLATATLALGCGSKSKVTTPEEVKAKSDTYMTCHMTYDFNKNQGGWLDVFELSCHPSKKNPDSRYESNVLPDCDFPNSDYNYVCEQCNPTEIVRYKGDTAISRAKKDFDSCGIDGLILDGGWWEAYVLGGTFPIMDAVSPFTRERLTEDELETIASTFDQQVVGALRTVGDPSTDRRSESYFQR